MATTPGGGTPRSLESNPVLPGTADLGSIQSLSPTELLGLADRATGVLDQQIAGHLRVIYGNIEDSRQIGTQREALQSLITVAREMKKNASSPIALQDLVITVGGEQLEAHTVINSYGLGELFGLTSPASPTDKLSTSVLESAESQLQTRQQTMNTGQEMALTWLQESMRQRSQAVEMVSSMLKRLADTGAQIVRNF